MDRTKPNTEKEIVPPPVLGDQSGAQADRKLNTIDEAKAVFERARKRLFDINHWHEYAGPGSSTFQLTDQAGNDIFRLPQVGDFIKINLPAPGNKEGNGYDWVLIEAIDDKKENIDEYAAIRVRPSHNPTKDEEDKIAHFHDDTATSTFIVQRQGTVVSAAEKGRNELQNKDDELSFFNRIRNILISFSTSKGAAWPQWKALMEGFLE